MLWKRPKSSYPLLIIGVFGVGLLLAGALLYKWIDRASVADREQQVGFLDAAMRGFRGDLAGTLLEIRSTFRPAPSHVTGTALDDYVAEFYSAWRANDPNARLVATLSVATLKDGKPQLRTLDPASGKFQPRSWPASLNTFGQWVTRISTHRRRGAIVTFALTGMNFAVEGNRPVVVIPLAEAGTRDFGPPPAAAEIAPFPQVFVQSEGTVTAAPPPSFTEFSAAGRRGFAAHIAGWCLLGLDLHYLQQQFLPRLLERTFSGTGLASYRVAILAGEPSRVVFSSVPGLSPAAFSSPDAELTLFGSGGVFRARFLGLRRRLEKSHPPRDWGFFAIGPRQLPSPQPVWRAHPQERGLFGMVPGPAFPSPANESPGKRSLERDAWTLVAKSKAGSIDAMVARSRRRNLAMGLGVLFLLACSMGALVFATHRARDLARREMEFVAGVSHELRTPLAAIHSAGFNLASGVVRKPNRIQEYGSLVQQEARRLNDMVEQVLNYAGIQSGERHYELVPTAVSEIVERALDEYGPVMRSAGWQVEKRFEENLPLVLADASSLESAVKNLLSNAMKYADGGKWISVSVRAVRDEQTAEVQISVEDRGPGIASSDLPHVFEPFYRSKTVLASPVPGAGLGLSILRRHIEAHGGRVSVDSSEGKGSEFTLHLPAVPALKREAV